MIKVDLSLLWTIINLVVFYLLLKKFLFKPVMGIMEKREQMIADGLKNASDRQEEAETLKKEYESALSGAKEESVKIVENARVEAKRQSDEILADADRGVLLVLHVVVVALLALRAGQTHLGTGGICHVGHLLPLQYAVLSS